MKKYIIHTESIAKVGAKQSFQIKLPRTTESITGLHIGINPRYQIEFGQTGSNLSRETGALWLRLSGNRDVFYADTVEYPDVINREQGRFLNLGLVGRNEWWFTGTKREFFKIHVPVESTIIEGYYEDQTTRGRADYDLKVYLETKINDGRNGI